MNRPRVLRASFLLRLWWEEAGRKAGEKPFWRGWVQHIPTGEAIYFQDIATLLQFVACWVGELEEMHLTGDSHT